MKIKSREIILDEIIRDVKKNKKGWKMIFGRDERLFSYDYYIFHPKVGTYFLKEYQKNPLEIKGIGGKIARNIDDEINSILSESREEFGILQIDI